MLPKFPEYSISPELKEKTRTQFFHVARPLEQAQYSFFFEKGSPNSVITELKAFQNFDGGFGIGLEPDFHSPSSSPMATSIGLQILDELPDISEKKIMIQKALKYLLINHNYVRQGWFAVSEEVNRFPHAPWWGWDPQTNMTLIDTYWGNPSAELIGYFWKYRELYPKWDADPFVEIALKKLEAKSEYKSEHEIYCYIRLYCNLNSEYKARMEPFLTKAITHLININPGDWDKYVPAPLNFLFHPKCCLWGISQDSIQLHIQYLLKKFEKDYGILPNWNWGDAYPNHWVLAYQAWTGVLTLRYLRILDHFGIAY